MRVVMAGGGSGGHVFPGIAVAEELLKREPECEVLFVGTERGLESRVVPRAGYEIRFLEAEGVLGKSALGKARAAWKIAKSVGAARRLYREFQPNVVIGTGGYVSVAPVLAARSMSIPTLLMEQNYVPGFATRMLARVADMVAVTYHESMDFLPRTRVRITGNPIRQAVMRGDRFAAVRLFGLGGDRVTVLVLGGSSGAARINTAMCGALNHLLDLKHRIQFIHQTGERDLVAVARMYRQMGYGASVSAFIAEMPEAYALADALVSRAGATTIAEATVLGIPSVLVPYPYAAGHQEMNALKLLDAGACRLIRDEDLTAETLAEAVRELCTSEDVRREMGRNCRTLGRPEAAQKVADLALSLARTRRGNV